MKIINLNISYNKSIGELSDVRSENLKKGFSEYTIFEKVQNSDTTVLRNDENGIAINDSNLGFISREIDDDSSLNVSSIKGKLDNANSILELSNSTKLIVKFEGFEKFDYDIMSASKNKFIEESSDLSSMGIGYRFMVDSSDIFGDIKLEPYVNDDSMAYYCVELHSKEVVELSNVEAILNEMFKLGIDKAKSTSVRLFAK